MEVLINNADIVCAGCEKEGTTLHLCGLYEGVNKPAICINLCSECVDKLDTANTKYFL